MKNRNRFIITLLLVISMVLSNLMVVAAEEISEEINSQSANEGNGVILSNWSEKLVNNYRIINEPGDFTEVASTPYSDVVLTSFTNTFVEQQLLVTAYSEDTEKIYLTNKGTVTASGDEPYGRYIVIYGFDGHGEEFYINRNLLDISDAELNNIQLGNIIETPFPHYEPVSGFGIRTMSKAIDENENPFPLTPTLEVVTDTYDYTGAGQEQTWIKITYTHPEEEKPLTKDEQIKAYKDSFPNRVYYDNDNNFIEVVSGNIFSSKKLKPVVSVGKTLINTVDGDDSKVSEIYDTIYYSSDNKKQLKIKYKNNKNAGLSTAIIKKCKARPELNGKEIQFTIDPITVSDNNMDVKIKNGKVKSVKVMTGNKMKKVSKKMWKVNGNVLNFTGNYTGSVSLNSIN